MDASKGISPAIDISDINYGTTSLKPVIKIDILLAGIAWLGFLKYFIYELNTLTGLSERDPVSQVLPAIDGR